MIQTPVDVVHDNANDRFVAEVEGHQATLEYRRQGDTMVITHTGVPAAIGGRGIAGVLTRAALESARSQKLKVLPACSYAAAFLKRHDEYTDLLV